MKRPNKILTFLIILSFNHSIIQSLAQIPMPKRKGDKDTTKQKFGSDLPFDLATPSASASLPGNTKINNPADAKKFATETLPDLGLKIAKKFKELKKELIGKKKEFNGKDYEGFPVEKQLIRQGSGSRRTFFEFYTLKQFQQPNPYQRNIFWYDTKTDRIIPALARDHQTNKILHGPYTKFLEQNVVEEGFYYLGAKHGRWEKYDKDFNLLDKEKYEKGFFAESKITFYDEKQTKIKEVLPKNYGKITGEYYFFNESGTLAEQGMMDDSVKIGQWIEYFPLGNKRKKETQYGKDCYDKSFEPYVLREYDEKGKLIFEAKK